RGADDIVDLASHFVETLSRRYRKGPLRLAPNARPALAEYAWPGNVRELENTIERAGGLSQGPMITLKDLALGRVRSADSMIGIPVAAADAITMPPDLELKEVEQRYAKAILDREGGNQTAAAKALGISRNKLARLLK